MQTCFYLGDLLWILSLFWVEKLGEVGLLLVMEECRPYCYSHTIQLSQYHYDYPPELNRTE